MFPSGQKFCMEIFANIWCKLLVYIHHFLNLTSASLTPKESDLKYPCLLLVSYNSVQTEQAIITPTSLVTCKMFNFGLFYFRTFQRIYSK